MEDETEKFCKEKVNLKTPTTMSGKFPSYADVVVRGVRVSKFMYREFTLVNGRQMLLH